jgi:hypothetical protein
MRRGRPMRSTTAMRSPRCRRPHHLPLRCHYTHRHAVQPLNARVSHARGLRRAPPPACAALAAALRCRCLPRPPQPSSSGATHPRARGQALLDPFPIAGAALVAFSPAVSVYSRTRAPHPSTFARAARARATSPRHLHPAQCRLRESGSRRA